ncbi:beta-phosphoglucomutase [Alkalicoccus halolimnae]|uniref:Beta-phosphoglucomutase n=1 Tax=Alkalicoccus halolimnae TaxID=1667239 RepID=A0A5C7FAT6_9BACI|nr:beta-phosphoglucomutase [Alkalicoccus halolimnae]TXF87243.1 beta-phosphoglucomutase [Alkalicoccus halolimnae]
MKACIFDLDGVIADTVEFHYLASKKTADVLDITFTRKMNEQWQGRSRKALMEAMLFQSSETKYTEAELGRMKNDIYRTYINYLTPEDTLPGAAELIYDLKNNGVPLALASSSSNAEFVIRKLGLYSSFDYIVPVEDVKNMKPDPEIFLRAAAFLNISPKDCAGIEDSVAGTKAVKQAGMTAVSVGKDNPGGDIHVSSLLELNYFILCEAVER